MQVKAPWQIQDFYPRRAALLHFSVPASVSLIPRAARAVLSLPWANLPGTCGAKAQDRQLWASLGSGTALR